MASFELANIAELVSSRGSMLRLAGSSSFR